jgi:hypothetical protein
VKLLKNRQIKLPAEVASLRLGDAAKCGNLDAIRMLRMYDTPKSLNTYNHTTINPKPLKP